MNSGLWGSPCDALWNLPCGCSTEQLLSSQRLHLINRCHNSRKIFWSVFLVCLSVRPIHPLYICTLQYGLWLEKDSKVSTHDSEALWYMADHISLCMTTHPLFWFSYIRSHLAFLYDFPGLKCFILCMWTSCCLWPWLLVAPDLYKFFLHMKDTIKGTFLKLPIWFKLYADMALKSIFATKLQKQY